MQDPNAFSYSYVVPPECIASTAVEPRDSARLFVYETAHDRITHAHVRDLPQFIPITTLMVLNDTRVVPARVTVRKHTGGKVILLFLFNEWKEGAPISALSDRRLNIGEILSANAGGTRYVFTVTGQDEQKWQLAHTYSRLQLIAFFDAIGETPLPPYIKHATQTESVLRARYQTIFAEHEGSVAAPTASLHFTKRVFDELAARGVEQTKLTLDVGLGTFAPLREEQLRSGTLHAERVSIPEQTAVNIVAANENNRPIMAVGTTVCRSLESYARFGAIGSPWEGETDMFIRPPYHFALTTILMTNFHVPESSLMMLVQAFMQHKGVGRTLVSLYDEAIKERYRFFSFGDAMLIL